MARKGVRKVRLHKGVSKQRYLQLSSFKKEEYPKGEVVVKHKVPIFCNQ